MWAVRDSEGAKLFQRPSLVKEHLLEDEASPFPVQAGGGGCQQWLTGGLYTGSSFQGGNINLPQNLKRLREESVMYSAQTSTLDARAGNLLTSLLNCVVKAEILIEQWKGQDIEDLHSRGKDVCWKFSVRLCTAFALLPLKLSPTILDSDFPRRGCGSLCLLWRGGRGEQRDGQMNISF